MTKKMHFIGGGTFSHIRAHLALAMPAFGSTAKFLYSLPYEKNLERVLHLTAMASGKASVGLRDLITNQDVADLINELVADPDTAIIFFNPALCDYDGFVLNDGSPTPSGKHEPRLESREGNQHLLLTPAEKIIRSIRSTRKDIFLVAFKTTAGASEDEQYFKGLKLLKENSCNLVLANDIKTRMNMIITPEESRYCTTTNRELVLTELHKMALARYGLTFNRTTILPGEPIPWDSVRIPDTLRAVVNWCIDNGAYKPIRGRTVGHFSFRESENTFLVSRRKTNYTEIDKYGMVEVSIDPDFNIVAKGSKPSAGAQTQRLIFQDHPEYNCIIHFHCPLKATSNIPVQSQFAFECGSVECGKNTSVGLKKYGNLSAVMLDNHGPNIVFHHLIDPLEVIQFIDDHCDLTQKTGGYVKGLVS